MSTSDTLLLSRHSLRPLSLANHARQTDHLCWRWPSSHSLSLSCPHLLPPSHPLACLVMAVTIPTRTLSSRRKKKATPRTYLHSCPHQPLIYRGNLRSSVLKSTSVIHPTIRISLPIPSLQVARPPILHPSHPHSHFPSDAAGPSSLFQLPISNLPVESPPSTASQQVTNDPYHIRKLSTAHTGTAAMRPSMASIREIHVNLPPSVQEKYTDM